MKGNEARVVFYLHPVDQLKDGQVAKVKPLRNSFVLSFLLSLGLLISLGTLLYVIFQFGGQTRSQQRSVSTTDISSVTTTGSAVTEITTEVNVTSYQKRGNHCTAGTRASKETTPPGIFTFLCYKSKLKEYIIAICHLAEATALERSTSWLLYPLVASSSLLLAYLAFLIMQWGYSRSKLVQGWMRRLTGKSPKEEKMLLHTLPYYLAITRSSCEGS